MDTGNEKIIEGLFNALNKQLFKDDETNYYKDVKVIKQLSYKELSLELKLKYCWLGFYLVSTKRFDQEINFVIGIREYGVRGWSAYEVIKFCPSPANTHGDFITARLQLKEGNYEFIPNTLTYQMSCVTLIKEYLNILEGIESYMKK